MTETVCVILAEGDAVLRASLVDHLCRAKYSVTAVPNGLAYYRHLGDKNYAVALINLSLPDQPGQVLIDYTRRNTPSAIIGIAAQDTVELRVGCYRAGADLFLHAAVDGHELAAAIASLAQRYESGRAMGRPLAGWRLLARRRALAIPDGAILELSPKECRLLELLAPGDGTAVQRADLLERLYAREDESAERALETLVRRTRRKIAACFPGPSPILTQHGVGYAFSLPLAKE
ncbi:response regulator with CheY-like receiver domain and winged-helix DNA-binding domain [Thioflavicoccus mobilis 8321]|uniref:Response regulator with CheY-like receiver domain and winged-helix DNA-binding domain n=1 Tax=Thioflavicoccus mobilis 8321 TaxID=765912 RepID=L0GY21_9GAMM|nr:response regulator transcription factor [Thioflavicoccus mobilis]AGA90866.1 response regulator with CheY-like receiver domain and winged-helix DNA-binding domain [Thioflavicoccus mobilis 8321]